jgi:hypothetical protein
MLHIWISMVKQLISSLLPCHCINSCACPIFDSKVILEVYRQSVSSIQTWFFRFHVSRQRLLVVVHTIYPKPLCELHCTSNGFPWNKNHDVELMRLLLLLHSLGQMVIHRNYRGCWISLYPLNLVWLVPGLLCECSLQPSICFGEKKIPGWKSVWKKCGEPILPNTVIMCGRINEVFVSHVHKTVFYWLGDAVNESDSIHISSIYWYNKDIVHYL